MAAGVENGRLEKLRQDAEEKVRMLEQARVEALQAVPKEEVKVD